MKPNYCERKNDLEGNGLLDLIRYTCILQDYVDTFYYDTLNAITKLKAICLFVLIFSITSQYFIGIISHFHQACNRIFCLKFYFEIIYNFSDMLILFLTLLL